MVSRLAAVSVASLALLAPAAEAQQMDVARGTATQVVGPGETITYELEAVAGPSGEVATGLLTRTFTAPGTLALAVADVTCLAVAGDHAVVIGRIRPLESVNVGYEAQLVQIRDRTLEGLPDEVTSGTDPQFGGQTTFTECAAFLPPFPFPTQPVTAGDFQVIDGAPEEPPPPPDCDDDDDDDDDHDDDDGHHWPGGHDDDCEDDD